jgi:branched-chain amino acid transport system substrate-binding protein
MQEAYPFTAKPKGQAKDKQDFLAFGNPVPGANESLEVLATNKADNTCTL